MAVPGRKRALFRCVFRLHLPRSKWISRVRFLVHLPLLVFSPTWGVHILWCSYVVSSDDPRYWKQNVGLLLRLPLPSHTTNDVSAISRMCLSFTHQWWQATTTVHIWNRLIRVTQQYEMSFRRVTHHWKLPIWNVAFWCRIRKDA